MNEIPIKIETSDREVYISLTSVEGFSAPVGISLKFKEATFKKAIHQPELIQYALEIAKDVPAHIAAAFIVDWLKDIFKDKEADVSLGGKKVRNKKTQIKTKDLEIIIEETIKENH
ncbi:MAG: hypothetical protein ACXVKK_10455 [Flavisolibacter sp.]